MATHQSTPKSKVCSRCQHRKHRREFHTLRRNPDGLSYHCKDCEKALKQHYYPEKQLPFPHLQPATHFFLAGAEGLELAAFCTECLRFVPQSQCRHDPRGYVRRFLRCLPCRTASRVAWRAAHPEQDRANVRRNWHRNRERYLPVHRAINKRRLEDPVQRAKQYAAVAAWYAAHPERTRTKNSKRRARLKNAPLNDVTIEQWEAVITAAKGRCVYCPVYKPDCKACIRGRHTGMTVDHITALDNGGSNTLHNLVACCRSCNSTKQLKPAPLLVQPLLL